MSPNDVRYGREAAAQWRRSTTPEAKEALLTRLERDIADRPRLLRTIDRATVHEIQTFAATLKQRRPNAPTS